MAPDDAALASLVRAAQSGDDAAFSQLYVHLMPVVRRVVADNVHDRMESEDVAHEAFTRAYASIGRLREPDRFRPWLLSIARRAAIDHRRVRVRARSMLDEDPAGDSPHPDPGPDDLMVIREELAAMVDATQQLSARDATALAMVGHLGFSPAEVADVLGISPGAAKVVVHRARTRLRALLGETPE
jgi:RNA polymerase sigma factor (sigma-70 family)